MDGGDDRSPGWMGGDDRSPGWMGETIDRAERGMVGHEGAGGAPLRVSGLMYRVSGLAFDAGGFGGAGL
jgi:hypothetical protein